MQEPAIRKKSKWMAGLLAFLMPGTGHMYLGLMTKGVIMMLLVAIDICGIVYTAEGTNVLSIVLLSLLMPIIYFYNLFDALQSTDYVNEKRSLPQPGYPSPNGWNGMPPAYDGVQRNVPTAGVILIVVVLAAVVVSIGSEWSRKLFDSSGSLITAVVLIGVGLVLWLVTRWVDKGKND